MEFIRLFQAGGPVMYLLLICSIVVVTIAIERFLYYKNNSSEKNFLNSLEIMLNNKDFIKAQKLCKEDDGILAKVAQSGIFAINNNSKDINSIVEGTAAIVVAKLKENLSHLDTIVTVAPLLGLLGTVVGMIGSFSVLNIKNGQPLAITAGVGEALVATAFGLCVAVLSMGVYSYCNHILDKMITDIERVAVLIISNNQGGEQL